VLFAVVAGVPFDENLIGGCEAGVTVVSFERHMSFLRTERRELRLMVVNKGSP